MSAILNVILLGAGVMIALGACLAPLRLSTPTSMKVFIRQLLGIILFANLGALVAAYAAGGDFWIFISYYSGYISSIAAMMMILRNMIVYFHRLITTHHHEIRRSDVVYPRPQTS